MTRQAASKRMKSKLLALCASLSVDGVNALSILFEFSDRAAVLLEDGIAEVSTVKFS